MFHNSIFFVKPLIIGLVPSLAFWACVIPAALKLN
jgi:hypothetical protein